VQTQPTVAQTQPTMVQTQPTMVQTQPTVVQIQPTMVQIQPTVVENATDEPILIVDDAKTDAKIHRVAVIKDLMDCF